MKMKSVVLLVVAVACGLVAMLGVQQVLSGKKTDEAKVGKVLVATVEIAPGNPLNEENTSFKEVPLESIPKGAVTNPTQIAEKSLRSAAVPGEYIMQAKLTSDRGASNDIPKGMRVVTTSVNLTKTHSGLIRPGDRVDIMLSYKVRVPDAGMMARTKTILEFIEIFATDSIVVSQDQSDASELNAKNLSFLVTLEQAAILKLAESKGELHLALRNKHDDLFVNGAGVTEDILDDRPRFGAANVEEQSGPRDPELRDVRAQIASELAEPAAKPDAVAVVAPEPPAIPTWTVTVYAGKDVLEQKVPLPLDENGMTAEEAALAEREAALAEREAKLNAREAKSNGTQSSPTGAGEDDRRSNEAEQSPDQSEQPVDAKNGKEWKGVLKGFLTGA